MNYKISSFSIITCFACLCIIGASLIPLLSVQLTPSTNLPSLSVNYSWYGVSARVIEQEVTSKLEGMFNTVKGVKDISSNTYKESGTIDIQFKKNTDIDAARFEIASIIRQAYSELPDGVSYPQLSVSGSNENVSPILSYSINANESPYLIKKYAENYIRPKLSTIEGVNRVDIYGADPFDWVIEYNSDKISQLNISTNEIEVAVREYFQKMQLGQGRIISDEAQKEISIVLTNRLENEINWKHIPIKKIENRIIYLSDIATVQLKESAAQSYFRINGLNSINIVIYAEKGVNNINVAEEAKATIAHLQHEIGKEYSLRLTNDSTKFIEEEIENTQIKMFFSLLILFLLIYAMSRSLIYVFVLFLSVITNLLIAVIFYYAFKVELQLYSFAGITISFGIIVDNCIIMIDHLRNRGNKKVFLAIMATTLTTAGALLSTFLLDDAQQANLRDFTLVIAINISVSLFVSLYFVPALLEKINLKNKTKLLLRKRKQRVLKFTKKYRNIVFVLKKPAFKWALIVIFIFGFGLPVHLLPKNMEGEGFVAKTYNATIGNEWFFTEIKPKLEVLTGGTLRLFTENVFENSYYTDPQRTTLRVSGRMPDGCTIEQLNEVIMKMENYISSFKEIELFETRITSYNNSSISIYFKKEYELTEFPFVLKSQLESKAISLGGLDWSVYGVGQGFSNALYSGSGDQRIELEGYNYDRLYSYAEQLEKQIIAKSPSRVKDAKITSGYWKNSQEYFLDFDNEKMALLEVSPSILYNQLKAQTYAGGVSSFVNNNEMQKVKIVSDNYKKINVWDLKNRPVYIGKNQYKLKQIAEISKKGTGNTISKYNQQYHLRLVYNFIGTQPLAKKLKDENIKDFSYKLPMGYKVFEENYWGWDRRNKQQYLFIFVVILIIFFICSILLESLKQPFIIICMIPISFVGVFLTFYLFEFNFDQGGYASFILLCGISVNAALYILNDYNNLRKEYPHKPAQLLYFKAYNHKITPIILTIFSTMVGLIPFVWDGQKEAFWFSFAAGTIGGLLFSLVGILVYLPLFIFNKRSV